MNERVAIMRESVVKITQMLSGKGIKVTQRGTSAYVKADHHGRPILVNLPFLPDNATNELIDAIQGFLDHEVAHILFTDFMVIGKGVKLGVGGMHNIVEDSRIERCMAERFQGCASNLSNTGKFFLDKYTTPMLSKAKSAEETVGILMVPLIRAMAGQQIFKEFMKTRMAPIQATYDLIKDLAPKIEAAASTEDTLGLAKEISKRLKAGAAPKTTPPKAKPPKAPKSSKPPKEEKKEEEEKKPSAGEEKEDEEKDTEEKESDGEVADTEEKAEDEDETEKESGGVGSGDGEGEEDESEDEDEGVCAGSGEGAGEGEEGDGEGEGAASAGEDDGDGDEEGEGSSSEKAGKSEGEGEKTVDTSVSSSAVWEAIDKESKNGYDEAMSVLISNSAVEAAAGSDYLVYTKDADVVENLPVGKGYDPVMLTRLQDTVDHMVAPLQKDLERAITARSMSTYSSGHRSGRLHAANLSRLAVGDNRVFRRKHESTSKDVAVELVIDASGSMSGPKINTAAQTAYALAAVLERIGIKCEVICFTTGGMEDHSAAMAEQAKTGVKYSRFESLYMPILKGWNERMSLDVKARFAWLPNTSILRNNVDGECVEIAARRLLQRREAGKVMMVLSDGAPHAYGATRTLGPHLRKVVEDVTKAGVNVVGIGIDSDEVRHFYPKHLIINGVKDLPHVVMKELKALLV